MQEFYCSKCNLTLPKNKFYWSKSQGRYSYCQECKSKARKKYHKQNKQKARQRHNKWRKKCLDEGGDKALRWYFTRHLGSYRKKTREKNLPKMDIDSDYLVELFHSQNGRCYYTNKVLEWNNYGKKKASSISLSVDRKVPERGYIKGNIVLCTYFSNTSKGKLTDQEFYDFCKTVLAFKTHCKTLV